MRRQRGSARERVRTYDPRVAVGQPRHGGPPRPLHIATMTGVEPLVVSSRLLTRCALGSESRGQGVGRRPSSSASSLRPETPSLA
jgi:hypothetical protein